MEMILISISVLLVLYPDLLTGWSSQFDEMMTHKVFNQYDVKFTSSIRGLCATECFDNSLCLAFAYHKDSHQCYLYNRRLSEEDDSTTDAEGWRTYILNIDETNLALKKPTIQSSTFNEWEKYSSDKAVDGNPDTHSHTDLDNPSWWCVDLQYIYNITHIIIWNIEDEYSQRIKEFEIRLSSSGCSSTNFYNATTCYKNDGGIKLVYTVSSCNKPSSTFTDVRSVYISVDNYLHMREMGVYSLHTVCPGQ